MSRKSADPNARLKIILAARGKAAEGTVANHREMAAILGMTPRNLNFTIEKDPALPIASRGGEGIAWQFDVVAVLDHMIAKCRREISGNADKARRMAEIAGVDLPPDGEGMSLADLREINRLQMDTQRRKIEQRDLVPKPEVKSLITGFVTIVQTEVLATVSQLDPAGLWPAAVRADVADHLRGMLVRVHDKFGAWIADDAGDHVPDRGRARGARSRSALRKRA